MRPILVRCDLGVRVRWRTQCEPGVRGSPCLISDSCPDNERVTLSWLRVCSAECVCSVPRRTAEETRGPESFLRLQRNKNSA